jgi:pectin methylesterase-like acyl-CoA thioesterase
MMSTWIKRVVGAAVVAAAALGGVGVVSASAPPTSGGGEGGGVIAVPDDFATIQEAVDAAAPGDLILISPGTYNEAVDVATDNLTIRGLDRNTVVLDGELELTTPSASSPTAWPSRT